MELYDLHKDWHEYHNLAKDPDYDLERMALKKLLDARVNLSDKEKVNPGATD
jgi:hypothetical protein